MHKSPCPQDFAICVQGKEKQKHVPTHGQSTETLGIICHLSTQPAGTAAETIFTTTLKEQTSLQTTEIKQWEKS